MGWDLNFGISNVHAFENILSGAFHSTLPYNVLNSLQFIENVFINFTCAGDN